MAASWEQNEKACPTNHKTGAVYEKQLAGDITVNTWSLVHAGRCANYFPPIHL